MALDELECGCADSNECFAQGKIGFILDLSLGRHRKFTPEEASKYDHYQKVNTELGIQPITGNRHDTPRSSPFRKAT